MPSDLPLPAHTQPNKCKIQKGQWSVSGQGRRSAQSHSARVWNPSTQLALFDLWSHTFAFCVCVEMGLGTGNCVLKRSIKWRLLSARRRSEGGSKRCTSRTMSDRQARVQPGHSHRVRSLIRLLTSPIRILLRLLCSFFAIDANLLGAHATHYTHRRMPRSRSGSSGNEGGRHGKCGDGGDGGHGRVGSCGRRSRRWHD